MDIAHGRLERGVSHEPLPFAGILALELRSDAARRSRRVLRDCDHASTTSANVCSSWDGYLDAEPYRDRTLSTAPHKLVTTSYPSQARR